MKKKLPIFRGTGIAKANLSPEDSVRLAEQLPAPTFDADRACEISTVWRRLNDWDF